MTQACCSDLYLVLVGESRRGREIAGVGKINPGIPFAVYQCARCERGGEYGSNRCDLLLRRLHL